MSLTRSVYLLRHFIGNWRRDVTSAVIFARLENRTFMQAAASGSFGLFGAIRRPSDEWPLSTFDQLSKGFWFSKSQLDLAQKPDPGLHEANNIL